MPFENQLNFHPSINILQCRAVVKYHCFPVMCTRAVMTSLFFMITSHGYKLRSM